MQESKVVRWCPSVSRRCRMSLLPCSGHDTGIGMKLQRFPVINLGMVILCILLLCLGGSVEARDRPIPKAAQPIPVYEKLRLGRKTAREEPCAAPLGRRRKSLGRKSGVTLKITEDQSVIHVEPN